MRMIATSFALLLLFIPTSNAQNIPTPSGKCVYNCGAPLPAPSQGSAPTSTLPGQFGYELGRSIVRSMQRNDNAPPQTPTDPENTPDRIHEAQRQLDQWASEDPQNLPPCNVCEVNRSRCFTGCDSLPTNSDTLKCVNRCNANYDCVQGSGCK